MEAVRDLLAWQNIASRIEEMNLSPQQAKQATTRRDQAQEGVTSRIAQTYIWAIVPEQPDPSKPLEWTVEKADGQEISLAARTSEKLVRAGLFTDIASPRMIRMDLDSKLSKAWESGHLTFGQLWSFYCSYPYLTRMKNRKVLADAVSESLVGMMFEEEGFALAEGFENATGNYVGIVIPGAGGFFGAITDLTLVVKPEVAKAQIPKKLSEEEFKANEITETTSAVITSPAGVESKVTTRFFGVYEVDPERYSRDLNRLSQEILQHLSSIDGIELNITIEIHAALKEGFSSEKIRVILENARSLRFKNSSFEGK
jgi:hypothetical protein